MFASISFGQGNFTDCFNKCKLESQMSAKMCTNVCNLKHPKIEPKCDTTNDCQDYHRDFEKYRKEIDKKMNNL